MKHMINAKEEWLGKLTSMELWWSASVNVSKSNCCCRAQT